jgi:hypothetical protein
MRFSALLIFYVLLSLAGIASGLVVLLPMINARQLKG